MQFEKSIVSLIRDQFSGSGRGPQDNLNGLSGLFLNVRLDHGQSSENIFKYRKIQILTEYHQAAVGTVENMIYNSAFGYAKKAPEAFSFFQITYNYCLQHDLTASKWKNPTWIST